MEINHAEASVSYGDGFAVALIANLTAKHLQRYYEGSIILNSAF